MIVETDTPSPTGGLLEPSIVFRDNVSIPDTTVPRGTVNVNTQDMRSGAEYAREIGAFCPLFPPTAQTYPALPPEADVQDRMRDLHSDTCYHLFCFNFQLSANIVDGYYYKDFKGKQNKDYVIKYIISFLYLQEVRKNKKNRIENDDL